MPADSRKPFEESATLPPKPASQPAKRSAAPPASADPSTVPPSADSDTGTLRGPPPTNEAAKFPFLAPAQTADELGRLGHFRVLKVLGKGGMGVVFQGEDSRLRRAVALKAMLPDWAEDPAAKERFLREARAAATIEHDHIVAIYEVNEDRGVPYIAMPLLRGTALDDWLKEREKAGKPLTLGQILKIGREIAKGLAAAHERGLIHRDIKPANIWLDASAGGRVKILDFGVARPTTGEPSITQSGVIVGTPAYMAPEQAQSQTIDGRADLFSLGVVLYRLCTGQLPFKGHDSLAMIMAIATQAPTPPSSLRPDLAPELSELVMKLLEKDPNARPKSAKDVVKALQTLEREIADAATERVALTPPPARPGADSTEALSKGGASRVSASSGGVFRRLLIAAAAVAAIVAGIVFSWQTPHGLVRFEIDDPTIKVSIDQSEAVITGADAKPISLKPGKHGLTITRGDFTFDTATFELAKGGNTTLKIEWFAAKKMVVLQDGKQIGEKPAPALISGGPPPVKPPIEPPVKPPIATTPGDFALHFDGLTQHIEIADLRLPGSSPYTMEGFFRPDADATGGVDSRPMGVAAQSYLSYTKGGTWRWVFAKGTEAKKQGIAGAASSVKGQFIACVYDGKEQRFYVDGKLFRSQTQKPGPALVRPFEIGVGFKGAIDEVRVSKIARYDADFKPTIRFETDKDTLALYHFDEGKGNVLNDSSGNERHGKILGATWVKSNVSAAVAAPKPTLAEMLTAPDSDWSAPENLGPGINTDAPELLRGGLTDIWMFRRDSRTKPFGDGVRLPEPVNTTEFDVPVWISNDGRVLCTRSQWKKESKSNLWVRPSRDASFGPPLTLAPWSSHVGAELFIAADGARLYFDSDAPPGGQGKKDIWMVRRVPKK